jgi:uncharacterized protein
MKKETKPMRMLPLALVCSAMLMMPQLAGAECCQLPEHTLYTQGHGEVKAAPDALAFTATTEGTATTVAEAQKKAQGKMTVMIANLKALEKALELSKPLKLQTQGVNIYPVYEEKTKLRKIIGYKSSNTLRVMACQSTGKLGEAGSKLMEVAARDGSDTVGGLTFFVDDMDAPKLKALGEAIANAKRQADVMAKGLGITLKGIQSAEGTPQYGYSGGYMADRMMMKVAAPMAAEVAPPPPVETGEVSVTCDVSVRFLIQD